METEDELVTITTFTNTPEAKLAKERLQAEGIEAVVLDEMTAGLMPYVTSAGGVRLQVAGADVQQAREILGLEGS